MRAIEVTEQDTDVVAIILVHNIISISPSDDGGTTITVVGGETVYIQESYEELKQYFRKAPKFTNHV